MWTELSCAQSTRPNPVVDDFLDRLVGTWVATDTTHDPQSPQTLQVDWVLDHEFLRIDPFFIGYDRAQKRYVLHALNARGADGLPVAYGERQGNEIKFEACTGQRNVDLRLIWHPESQTWRRMWGSRLVGEQWQAVTDLVLTRAR
jgi:hypothetical protein